MATKNTLEKAQAHLERLRRESLETVIAANKIVYSGVQQIADSELKLLNESYRSAVRSLKKSRDAGSHRDAVGAQIEILQETANRVIGAARETLHIVIETRKELTQLVRRHANGASVPVAKADAAVKQARRAVKETVAKARRSTSRRAPQARASVSAATATKPAKTRKPAGKRATRKVSATVNAPNSRANAATTRAKRANAKATPAGANAATSAPAAAAATTGNDSKAAGSAA